MKVVWKTVGVTVVETRTIKHTLEEAKRELESRLDPDSRWGILMAELVREVEQCHIDLEEYARDEEERVQNERFR